MAGDADYSSKKGANAPKLLVALGGATPQACSGTATATPTPGATATQTPTNTSAPTATQPPQGAFNSATFVYDGDGKRVKSTFNGTTTTYFVGTHYEVTGSTITKYYYAGSQRIAMRTNSTLNYLLGDHLGSTSLTTNSSGQIVSELRYKAWGETRYASGTTPTKYTYTGQYSYVSDFGLHFYNARWYDSSLGRFAQADSIIPQNQGVQAWDRYAYTNNNPLRYSDPSGHCAISDHPDDCFDTKKKYSPADFLDFTGYSDWERDVLQNLSNSGQTGYDAVQYILNNNVQFTFDSIWSGNSAQWQFEGENQYIVLNSDTYSENTATNDAFMLSVIAHEAKHLEQGPAKALSVAGEHEGWQVGIQVSIDLGQGANINPWFQEVHDLPVSYNPITLVQAAFNMKMGGGLLYMIEFLPLYPSKVSPAYFFYLINK